MPLDRRQVSFFLSRKDIFKSFQVDAFSLCRDMQRLYISSRQVQDIATDILVRT
jgi:hypothetical protein